MNKLDYHIFSSNDVGVKDLEELRDNIIGVDDMSTYYLDLIHSGNVVGVGCFYQGQLIGGAYVLNSYNSLFIEYVFVKDEFQNSSLHVGSSIVKYILDNKEIFEKYFGVNFDFCRLESRNTDSFYSTLGFKKENNILETMRKRL